MMWSALTCLVSLAKRGGHYDDDDDDEDSQTDGDPNLLLHWKKQNFHLAHKLILTFCSNRYVSNFFKSLCYIRGSVGKTN